eukprot:c8750_g1_i1.p1 GENE.c8750_g1_i1~~c8750_g1_i1.p1  ORF type:complete len:226 (+),score=51.02 c8750_g1_i1:94-678(+)
MDIRYGRAAMHWAAMFGRANVIVTLLELGCDVNVQTDSGRSPVYLAAYNNHVQVIQVLHKHGANINTPNKNGSTPLMSAALKGKTAAAQALIDLGASLEVTDKFGMTARDIAVHYNNPDIVNLIDQKWMQERQVRLKAFLMGTLRRQTLPYHHEANHSTLTPSKPIGGSIVLMLPLDVLGMIAPQVLRASQAGH